MRVVNRSLLLFVGLSFSLAGGARNAFAASICDAVPGNLVVDCGFESGPQATAPVVPGFTQAGNTTFTAITIKDLPSYDVNSGSYALQMGNGTTGSISQVLADTAGATLNLSFFLEGDAPATNFFSASFDGTTVFSLTNDATSTYQQYFATAFKATGSDTLTFSFYDTANYLSLDDIVVTQSTVASTPEPSSLVLLGTGALGLLGAARRRFLTV